MKCKLSGPHIGYLLLKIFVWSFAVIGGLSFKSPLRQYPLTWAEETGKPIFAISAFIEAIIVFIATYRMCMSARRDRKNEDKPYLFRRIPGWLQAPFSRKDPFVMVFTMVMFLFLFTTSGYLQSVVLAQVALSNDVQFFLYGIVFSASSLMGLLAFQWRNPDCFPPAEQTAEAE